MIRLFRLQDLLARLLCVHLIFVAFPVPSMAALIVFRDPENRFSLAYSEQWKPVASSHRETSVKLEFDHEEFWGDCGVVVTFEQSMVGTSPKAFVSNTNCRSEYSTMLEKRGLSVKVVESGRTQLANQDAVYFVSEFTHKSLSLETPIKQMQVSTVRQGFVFTLTFRCLPDQWDGLLPEFELLANGFRFTGKLLESTHVVSESDTTPVFDARSAARAREEERFKRAVPIFWGCMVLGVVTIVAMLKAKAVKVTCGDDLRVLRRQKRKGWIAVNFLVTLFLTYCVSLYGIPQGDPLTTIIPALAGYSTVGLIIAFPVVWICYSPMRAKTPKGFHPELRS